MLLAAGTGFHAQQKRAMRAEEFRGIYVKPKEIPVKGLTIGLSAGLLVCSIIYHSVQQ